MTDTVNLGLPCIEGSQAQKHVTHNDALRILDTLVQLAVLDRDLSAPPSSPAEGQRWIVKATGTGAWAGHNNAIAAWQDGAWQFSTPRTGWCAYVADEGTLLLWNGTAWGDFFSTMTSIQNLALLGVGTTADSTNVLSAKLNNTLFVAKTVAEGGDGNLRYKLSKESASKTLSFLLQNNFSGRAEVGLTGDDDFHFKVSPDGSTWTEGIRIAAATGKVTFPVSGGPREMLAANRTYYVRADGNDANNGLANTSGGAFLTFQAAVNAVALLDIAAHTVTIQVGDGTYAGAVNLKNVLGFAAAGNLVIQGNATTPSNVLISVTAAHAFTATGISSVWDIKNLKITTTTSGNALDVENGSVLRFFNLDFGAVASGWNHIYAFVGATVVAIGAYKISGSALVHAYARVGSSIILDNATPVTLTGTPAFTVFATCKEGSAISAYGITYSGSATGQRYSALILGLINSFGGGASYFPGNSAGSADATTFGVYQ